MRTYSHRGILTILVSLPIKGNFFVVMYYFEALGGFLSEEESLLNLKLSQNIPLHNL